MFYFEKISGKKVLKSDLIKGANAFFTTREFCIKSKDEEMQTKVLENKKLICKSFGISIEKLISPEQTHSSNIEIVSDTKTEYPNTDGLILSKSEMAIFLNFADCTPIILYDEAQNIGAISHAGWRGTASKIASLTVQKMIAEYNSNPKDISAVIGPAIDFCCYNVGEEVLEKLSKTVVDFRGLSETRNGNIYVDLKNINRQQLLEKGLKKIDVCPYCTVHNNDLFYSYRNENQTTNRHSAVLFLN